MQQILDFILVYQHEHRIAPSFAQIAKHLNLSGVGSVTSRYIARLDDEGFIRRLKDDDSGKGLPRTIQILKPVYVDDKRVAEYADLAQPLDRELVKRLRKQFKS